MAELEVGDILVDLQTSATDVTGELEKSIKQLRSFKRVMTAIEKMDMTKITNNFKAISSLNFNNIGNAFNSKRVSNTNKQISNTNKQLKQTKNQADNAGKSMSKLFSLGKIYFLFNYTKRLGQALVNVFQYAIDFEETLNKFTVSFGEYSGEARKFANEMAYAYNLSTESIMNYMSTFNNMLSALGSLDMSQTSKLSQTLTRMAVDYASLFNISVETAMSQFQSILSGSIRPIRSTSGYDVSETTIFKLYQELGGTKTMRQLSQLEKRLLRILAVQKQMDKTGAFGDFEATISNTANMLKQISETMQEIGRYMGTVMLYYFKDVIEGALTLLIVVRDITKSLAQGFESDIAIGGRDDVFGGLASSADNASDSIDELNGKLLSFDKFTALSSPTDQAGMTSDVENILASLGDYTSGFENVASSARDTADAILDWLHDPIIGDINVTLKDTYTNLDLIKDVLLLIASLGVANLLTKITTVGLIPMIGKLFTLKTLLATGIIFSLIKFVEAIKEGDTATAIITGTLGALIVTMTVLKYRLYENIALMFMYAKDAVVSMIVGIKLLNLYLNTLGTSLLRVTLGLGVIIGSIVLLSSVINNWGNMSGVQKVISVLGLLTTVALGASIALGAFHSAWSIGLATAGIVAGILAVVGAVSSAKNEIQGFSGFFEKGGFPTKGSLFVANEAGAELVGNIGGRTAVANNDMIIQGIENASYRGMVRAMSTQNGNKDTIAFDFSTANDSKIARALVTPMIDELKRQGYKVEKV